MGFGKFIALGIVAVIVGALLVVQTEVTPINPYPGAVAYAHPTLIGVSNPANVYDTSMSASLDQNGVLIGLPVQLSMTPLKYTAPAPVMKPLWQGLFPTGSIQLAPPRASPFAPGGCTTFTTRQENVTLHFRVFATMTVSGGSNGIDNWTSATKDLTLPATKTSFFCGLTPTPTIAWTVGSGSADFEPGAYYFHGWGTYTVIVKVFRDDGAGAAPVQVSSVSQGVTVSPTSFGP